MSGVAGAHTPEPWWTDAKYCGREMGVTIIAANTDAGPLPGNPTRGMVAFVNAALNAQARECEANAARIVACVNALAGIPTDQLSTLMGEVRGVLAQYRDDLRRPPTGDSAERRLAAITTLLAKLGSGS